MGKWNSDTDSEDHDERTQNHQPHKPERLKEEFKMAIDQRPRRQVRRPKYLMEYETDEWKSKATSKSGWTSFPIVINAANDNTRNVSLIRILFTFSIWRANKDVSNRNGTCAHPFSDKIKQKLKNWSTFI